MLSDILMILYGFIIFYLAIKLFWLEEDMKFEKERAKRMERVVFAYKDKINVLIEQMKEDSNGTR